ncbi:hypothetical protein GCM10028791_20890 [Echinicola sediminis]
MPLLNQQQSFSSKGLSPSNVAQSQASESDLWISFLRGSDAALAKIYRAYSDKLFSYGRQFTSNEMLIQDAVQDVFFKLVDNREKLGVAQSVKFYLFSSFRRILMRLIKRERKYVEENGDGEGFYFLLDEDYFTMDAMLSKQQKGLIKEACNGLTVRQREMLNLRFFENLSYAEIADMLGMANAKTVRTMLYRILGKLSEKLSPFKRTLLSLLFAVCLFG